LAGGRVGITDERDLCCTPLRRPKCHDINIPSFMKNGTGIQAILRLCFINLRGCNIGIIDGRDL
jgi:hypothetical protein